MNKNSISKFINESIENGNLQKYASIAVGVYLLYRVLQRKQPKRLSKAATGAMMIFNGVRGLKKTQNMQASKPIQPKVPRYSY